MKEWTEIREIMKRSREHETISVDSLVQGTLAVWE